jgi:branched-chain amino acid transport system ATP-binding protein
MGLIGPNGAGKTTLLNVVSGYVAPSAGRVLLSGTATNGLRPHQVARRGLARTFQTPKLVRELTVLENVMLGVDGRAGWLRGRRSSGVVARADELLQRFGLRAWRDRDAGSLPLSSQKVVEVARALVAEPVVILLDEPAAGLGADDVERLIEPLRLHAAEHRLAILIIEHDIELIARLCSHVAVLNFGKVIAEGTPSHVLQQPEVVNAYLGAGFAAAVG